MRQPTRPLAHQTTSPLRALIIDDEPLAHRVIETYCENLDFLEITGRCHKATEAYALLEKQAVDLIFLDINMPQLTGLDFLRTLTKKPRVIITTAYKEYALESFDLQVSDYLLKPFGFPRFLQAVQKVRAEVGAGAGAKSVKTSEADHLFVRIDRQYHRVNFADIHYLESYGNYVKIWTGPGFLLATRTLNGLTAELPQNDFLKIHKSYVVRKAAVEGLNGNQLVLHGGVLLPVGKLQREAVNRWIKR